MDAAAAGDSLTDASRAGNPRRAIGGLVTTALLLVAVTVPFLFATYRIRSESMRDTLLEGDCLIVGSWEFGAGLPGRSFRFPARRAPRRGEVVVFEPPLAPGEAYVKRCVAVGGDTIEVRDKRVVVNGRTLEEPYALHRDRAVRPAGYDTRDNLAPERVPPGHVFVMGDNRDDSEDSRMFGAVPNRNVSGRPLVVYWSWDAARRAPRWQRLMRGVR